eukprot:scaffold260281_cov31-Tisochrysis_lutea.AAC.1
MSSTSPNLSTRCALGVRPCPTARTTSPHRAIAPEPQSAGRTAIAAGVFGCCRQSRQHARGVARTAARMEWEGRISSSAPSGSPRRSPCPALHASERSRASRASSATLAMRGRQRESSLLSLSSLFFSLLFLLLPAHSLPLPLRTQQDGCQSFFVRASLTVVLRDRGPYRQRAASPDHNNNNEDKCRYSH